MYALIFNIEDCSIEQFHYLDSKSNLIMDGVFTKLIYALPKFTINSIYIHFPIRKTNALKNYLVFDAVHDRNLFSLFRKLENDLLEQYSQTHNLNKKPNYAMANMFSYGKSKFFSAETVSTFLIKLSGIWESETEFGITFKIVDGEAIITSKP